MLVTDGSFASTKATAADLGTRLVHPRDFAILPDHLQPAVSFGAGGLKSSTNGQDAFVRGVSQVDLPQQAGGPGRASAGAETDRRVPAHAGGSAARRRPSAAYVRTWARRNGFDVGVRGRLAAEVWDAYQAGQAGQSH